MLVLIISFFHAFRTDEFILLNGHVSAVFKISLIKFLYSKKLLWRFLHFLTVEKCRGFSLAGPLKLISVNCGLAVSSWIKVSCSMLNYNYWTCSDFPVYYHNCSMLKVLSGLNCSNIFRVIWYFIIKSWKGCNYSSF